MKKVNNGVGVFCIIMSFGIGISTHFRKEDLQIMVALSFAYFLVGIGLFIKAENPW